MRPAQMPSQQLARSDGVSLAFRVLVCISVLGSADLWRAPVLLGPNAWPLVVVTMLLAASVLVGVKLRATSIALACALFLLVGWLQTAATIHVHHVVWLSILLSANAARFPARSAAFVLALVYFFPGVHKLVDPTSPFFDADSLVRLIRLKSFEAGAAVPFDLDQHPDLLLVGGACVIALELAMPLFAVVKPLFAFVAAIALHLVFWIAFHMPFTVLFVYAFVFLLEDRARRREMTSSLPSKCAAVVIAVGVTVAGVWGAMNAYPFACYPTFALPVATTIPDLDVYADDTKLTRDELEPLDVRTAALTEARSVRTREDARNFIEHRKRDERFRALVEGKRVRVVRVDVDLTTMKPVRAIELVNER